MAIELWGLETFYHVLKILAQKFDLGPNLSGMLGIFYNL